MSIIPARFKLTLYEGSTFDETWTFYTDADATTPEDFTGWTAAFTVRKDYDAAETLLAVVSDGVTVPPADDVLVLGADGTIRVYITDETMAALVAADFTRNEEGAYVGVWDLEVTNPAGETFRYAMGTVTLSREVTHA